MCLSSVLGQPTPRFRCRPADTWSTCATVPLSVKQTAEVRDNRPATVTMVLNAGMVRIRVPTRKTGEMSGGCPHYRQRMPTASLMLASRTGETTALLPAGRHVVRAELGLVRAEQTVTITAGRLVCRRHLAQRRAAATDDGRRAASSVFSVFEDDPDAPGGRREVARSAAQPAEFMLPPGTYYIVARQGVVEARERLAVGPGDVVRRTLSRRGRAVSRFRPSRPHWARERMRYISYTITRIDSTCAGGRHHQPAHPRPCCCRADAIASRDATD